MKPVLSAAESQAVDEYAQKLISTGLAAGLRGYEPSFDEVRAETLANIPGKTGAEIAATCRHLNSLI
jgi:hypothetical protein